MNHEGPRKIPRRETRKKTNTTKKDEMRRGRKVRQGLISICVEVGGGNTTDAQRKRGKKGLEMELRRDRGVN